MRRVATQRDRRLIAADMSKVAESLRYVEDFLEKFGEDYSKIPPRDRKVVAQDLNSIADDMAYIEREARKLGLYDEMVSYVKEATKESEKSAREKVAGDLYEAADELELAEKRLARGRINQQDYDKVASEVASKLEKIADFAEQNGIEIESAEEEKEEKEEKEKESSSYVPLQRKPIGVSRV